MNEELMEWYNTVPYAEIKNIIRDRMSVMAREYVGIGFYLRRVRDNEMYLEDGYKDVHEFAAAEFGMSRSTINHCMRINEQFSVDGNSPTIDSRYKDFNKSQLQEMLYLSADKLDEVTPDMTVKEIRSMKNDRLDVEPKMDDPIPAQMSIEDYPECMSEDESSTDGSGQSYNARCITGKSGSGQCGTAAYCVENVSCCLECDMDCNTRCGWLEEEMAEADCVTDESVIKPDESAIEADENVIDAEYREVTEEQPKRSDTMLTHLVEACIEEFELGDLFAESGDADIFREDASFEMSGMSVRFRIGDDEFRADFNDDISIHNAKTEKELDMTFSWDQFFEELERIRDVGEKYAAKNAEMEEVCCKNSSDLDELTFSQVAIRDYLEEEEQTLSEYEKVNAEDGGLPINLMMRQRMLVKALRLLMENEAVPEEDEEPEEQEEHKAVQPELPILKNNDQRKEWLKNYKAWGLWYRDDNIDVNYYKYDFCDGSRLVVAEYPLREGWMGPKDEYYFHFLEKNKKKYGSNDVYDEKFRHHSDSETYMIEFLKEVQKK